MIECGRQINVEPGARGSRLEGISFCFCFVDPTLILSFFFLLPFFSLTLAITFTDNLIDNLSQDMSENRKQHSSHNSRYNVYETRTYTEERSRPESRNYYGSSGSLTRTPQRYSADEKSDAHKDYLYSRYGKPTGSRQEKASTLEEGWYKSSSREDLRRSVSPRHRPQSYNSLAPTTMGRPFSVLSKSPTASPYSSRAGSPILRTKYGAHSRSVSPKNVHIGPVTEMIEFKRELEREGQQEYFRGRDSRQGKVSCNTFALVFLFFPGKQSNSRCILCVGLDSVTFYFSIS